jgi:hypothetical protein
VQKLSAWELRQRAEAEEVPVSGKQFASYQQWGLLPERLGGGWWEQDVARLVEIRKLGETVRSLHRRVILLRDYRYPTPPNKLQEAMIATIPSITGPIKKARCIHQAHRVKGGEMTLDQAQRQKLPDYYRPPEPRAKWEEAFRWPTPDAFDQIAGSTYFAAETLVREPYVRESKVLEAVPYEEVIVLMMTYQLTIGDRVAATQGLI